MKELEERWRCVVLDSLPPCVLVPGNGFQAENWCSGFPSVCTAPAKGVLLAEGSSQV